MRFQLRVFLAFVALLVAVVALLITISFQFERNMLDKVEGSLQEIVRTVNLSTRELTLKEAHSPDSLKVLVNRFLKMPGVEAISLINNRERIIISSDSNLVGRHDPLRGGEIFIQQRSREHNLPDWHVRYDVRVPIIRNEKVVGALWAVLVISDFRLLFRDLYLKTVITAGAGLLLAFAASFLILYRLGRPLRELATASHRVSSGDMAIYLSEERDDEFKGVFRAFNEMVAGLRGQKNLEDRLHALERQSLVAEMAAHLAHEIRNPLNLINLTVDQLVYELGQAQNKNQAPVHPQDPMLLESLKGEVKHLDAVVRRFLELGRPGRLYTQRFPLSELLDDIRLLLGQRFNERGIAYVTELTDGLMMVGDQEQLRLLLLNLVLNASALVPEGAGQIGIRAGIESGPLHPQLRLEVADNGPGIAPLDLPRLFEPYFTRREGGTGLGLALARRIASEHGGSLQASNRPQGGALFTLLIPQPLQSMASGVPLEIPTQSGNPPLGEAST